MALAVGNPTYYSDLPKLLIAWHSRDSAGAISGVTTTETGFIRIDGINIRNGYHYLFSASQVNATATTTTTVAAVNLRFATGGSSATTSSSRLPYGGFLRSAQPVSSSATDVFALTGQYHASADTTLSVIMSVVRDGSSPGTGSVGIFASVANPCPLFVYEMGLYPSVSGTDL